MVGSTYSSNSLIHGLYEQAARWTTASGPGADDAVHRALVVPHAPGWRHAHLGALVPSRRHALPPLVVHTGERHRLRSHGCRAGHAGVGFVDGAASARKTSRLPPPRCQRHWAPSW